MHQKSSQILTVYKLLHSNYRTENKINGTDFGCREHPVAQTREDPNQRQRQNGFKRVTNIKYMMYSF